MQGVDGVGCQDARLVESALSELGAMKRHGDHKQRCGGVRKLCDGAGEDRAQSAGNRLDAIVFQRMDRSAHAAFISTEGDGADKRRRRKTAGAAKLGGWGAVDRRRIE